jgi:hypothetical protein
MVCMVYQSISESISQSQGKAHYNCDINQDTCAFWKSKGDEGDTTILLTSGGVIRDGGKVNGEYTVSNTRSIEGPEKQMAV